MKRFNPLNHITTAVAVIDKNMTVVDANESFKNRSKGSNVVGSKSLITRSFLTSVAVPGIQSSISIDHPDNPAIGRKFASRKQ